MTRQRDTRLVRDRASGSRERGAATLEHLGVLAIAAILIAAVVIAVSNSGYGGRLQQALCEITSLGQGDCGSTTTAHTRSPADYVPKEVCVVTADGATGSVKAGVLLTGGVNGDWLIETLADGTYRLTRGE